MLAEGGSAVDAVLATAITLSLVEPVSDPVVEIHTHSVGEGGFMLEVVQRHSVVPKETAERFSNQAMLTPAAPKFGSMRIASLKKRPASS